jgi:hypothetical protein
MNTSDQAEHRFGNRIKSYLDQGAGDLKPGVAYRLQEARRRALDRIGTVEAGQAVVAGRGSQALALAGMPRRGWRGRTFLLLGVLLLAGGLLYFDHWRTVHEHARELGEIDAELLAADLPYDAFLDRGFQNWLFRGEEQ